MIRILSKTHLIQRGQLEMVALDQLVPEYHLVRKMEEALYFSFIYDLVKDDLYLEGGRPRKMP